MKNHPIFWKGQPVLTSRMLAEKIGINEENIKVNFNSNKKRFTEEKEFFLLKGFELKEFKKQIGKLNLPVLKGSHLYLWTESGCHNHAKIAETDEAWNQFENLRDTYFRQKEIIQILTEPIPENPLEPHLKREVQIQNTKEVKAYNWNKGGKEYSIEYFIKSCKLHSGYTPKELQKITNLTISGREIIRKYKPWVAASISISDECVKQGIKLEDIAPKSVAAQPLLEELYKLKSLNINN